MKLRMIAMVACASALVLDSAEPAFAHNEVPSVTVRENYGFATIWIYPACPVAMSYRTEDGTAKAREQALIGGRQARGDYRASSGHTVRGGAVAFRIPIVNDAVPERTETARAIVDITTQEVSFGVGAAGCSPGTPTFQTIEAVLTIVDND